MRYNIDQIAICLSLIYILHFCGCNPSAPESHRGAPEAVEEHGHDEHGHDEHGHDEHGHDEHGHDEHGHDEHGHDEHGHDEHGHDEHDHDEHDHDEHGHDEHGHDEHGSDHPETYAEAVALVAKLQLQIKETLATGDIKAADVPLHELGHVLEAIPALAGKQSLSEADEEAVHKAVDTLFDAFGQIDEKVHGAGEPSYAPYAKKIESAIGTLQSFAPQQ